MNAETKAQFLGLRESSQVPDVNESLHLWSQEFGWHGWRGPGPCWFLWVCGSAQTGCQLICMQWLSKNTVSLEPDPARGGVAGKRAGYSRGVEPPGLITRDLFMELCWNQCAAAECPRQTHARRLDAARWGRSPQSFCSVTPLWSQLRLIWLSLGHHLPPYFQFSVELCSQRFKVEPTAKEALEHQHFIWGQGPSFSPGSLQRRVRSRRWRTWHALGIE